MSVPLDGLPEVARDAALALRDALLDILGDDVVAAWLAGGTTFPDRPVLPGDLDVCGVIRRVEADERRPRHWKADPASRPSRVYAAQDAIARAHGVEFDTTYLLAEDMARGRLPSAAFRGARRENAWAIHRAHWLAGQYVHLHGRRPEELVRPPTPAEIRYALDRELEHLERHVLEGDAADPYEATYAIWNGCRILRTLETGSPVVSKRSAGAWGLEHLPERWQPVIQAAYRAYDGVAAPEDLEALRAAMAPFVQLVRDRLPRPRRRRPFDPPRWS